MVAAPSIVKRIFMRAVRGVFEEYRDTGNVRGDLRKIGNASKNIP
jgi:hypothetical protein